MGPSYDSFDLSNMRTTCTNTHALVGVLNINKSSYRNNFLCFTVALVYGLGDATPSKVICVPMYIKLIVEATEWV